MIVIIVGGSLGGLFAGLVVKRAGHKSIILERNPNSLLQNQGAGVVAGGDTRKYFAEYDATKTPIAVTSPIRMYLNKDGQITHREEWEQKMTSWDLLYYILRANYDGLENGYCKAPVEDTSAEYRVGSTVTAITANERGSVDVSYTSSDGETCMESADLVIGADGPSSTVRRLLQPETTRQYAGYVAWRGTVPELELSDVTGQTLVDKFVFYHSKGTQILSYAIPGTKGALARGERLVNWVWYCNYPEGSQEFAELMTDSDGKKHQITLPVGKMQDSVWQKQRDHASRILPPQFAELVCKTQFPFVQAVTDVINPVASYLDGKVLLVGDALAGFRPHTAASTSQAAFDSLCLADLLSHQKDLSEWEAAVMQYAKTTQAYGVQLGERSQFEVHPLAGDGEQHVLSAMAR